MIEQNSRRVSRRSVLQSTAALVSVPFVAKATSAWAVEKIAGTGEVIVYSYGGSFTERVRQYVYEPFTKATGIRVVDVTADLAEPQVKAMNSAKRVDWDVAFATMPGYPELREAGVLLPIDYSLWDDEALKGVPEFARHKDAVLAFQSGNMLVYDKRAFPTGGPKNWADFWNVKEFPGPRGLDATLGYAPILYALIADGVANKDVWPLTDTMIDRALKKLDEIKPHISRWWTAGGEPMQLLINREYALTSSFDGRALAALQQGAPIRMVWDGAVVGDNYWTVLKGGPNSANAQKFVAFVNRAEIAAGFTQGTGYPGPNTNQLKYLPADLVPLISINPDNSAKTIRVDSDWVAGKRPDGKKNWDYLQDRWLAWRAQ